MTSQVFNQCPVLLDSSSQCVRSTLVNGTEALFGEADTAFAGQSASLNNTNGFTNGAVGMGTTAQRGSNPGLLDGTVPQTGDASTYNVGQGMRTDDAEDLGDGAGAFNEMAFSIEKVTVTAKSRL